MSQSGNSDPAPSGWARTAAIVAVAVIAAVTLVIVLRELDTQDRPFEIVVDRNSGVSIKAHAGEGIEALIDRAFEESAASVGGVLANRGFYKLHSDNMITALELTEPDTLPESTLRRYRKLLGDFEGPFRRPGTLLESDGRLLSAIEDLEAQVRASRTTNQLIADLWQESLDQQGIFRPRLIRARIVLLSTPVNADPDRYPALFACPGNPIKDRLVTIGAPTDAEGNLLPATSQKLDGVVRDDPFLSQQLGCSGDDPKDLSALLMGEPMVLGLDFASLRTIVEVPEGSDEEIFAWVQVRGGFPS
jgi:hypothetical protein